MINKWSELKKGDKLYLLIPMYNEDDDIIEYEYQESYVINIKICPDNLGINLRFKYTDISGLRKRCNVFISSNRDDVKVLSVNSYHFAMKPIKFGEFLATYYNPEVLKDVFNVLVNTKQKEIKKMIDTQTVYLKKLEKLKNMF